MTVAWGDINKRRGWFEFNPGELKPEEIMAIMGRCIIIRARALHYLMCYEALSLDFEEVPNSQILPGYKWDLRKESDLGQTIYKAEPKIIGDSIEAYLWWMKEEG